MKTAYKHIDPDYFELFEESIGSNNSRVIYFDLTDEPILKEAKGNIKYIERKEDLGYYIIFQNNDWVRADRIVVFNGKPGPAYDEYDAYGLAPLTCKAGYDDDDECL